jgi:hypothetical protein
MFGKNWLLANAAVFGYSSCRGRRIVGVFGRFEQPFSRIPLDIPGVPDFVALGHIHT